MISEFAKEKVFWTRKMNLKLVKFIEGKPNIWNPKHPKYTSMEYKERTYAEFASKYGNEFTGQAVKDRWTNIRSTFANYLRKLKASQAKGDGEEYKVNWHLWHACSFLLEVNRNGHSRSRKKNSINQMTIDTNEEPSSEEDNISTQSRNNDDNMCQNIVDGIINAFQGLQNDVFDVDNLKYGKLGRTLATKLSQMSSFDAAQLTNKVMDVLWLYHEDSPLNPNNVKLEEMN
ncbi:uncharacterized protein LOC142980559 [Anticarsia gemmatalis]|uniref:uncharacterized protein LOC142980559 n=1 Tax=Anticarsia gemmatalis TaxID=129554 RepID=UPI003F761391